MGPVLSEFEKVIAERIREDQFRSYKTLGTGGGEKHPWLKSICSFLNSDGGKLYLGVGEDAEHLPNEVIPTERLDRDTLSRLITSNIDPPISGELFDIREESITGGTKTGRIFLLEVKPSQVRPHSYKGRFYWRRDDEDVYMNRAVIERKIIEAQAETLIFEELRHNGTLASKIVEATQPCHTDKDFGIKTVYSFTKMQTIAWRYLWEHGLITMLGEDFEDLRRIYYETQSTSEIVELLRSGYRGMYGEDERGGSYDAVRKLNSKAADIITKINEFLTKKGQASI